MMSYVPNGDTLRLGVLLETNDCKNVNERGLNVTGVAALVLALKLFFFASALTLNPTSLALALALPPKTLALSSS